MKQSRIAAWLLCLALLVSLAPPMASAAAQDERQVWLHAQGTSPTVTTNITTAYLSDPVDVYFAIDDPNKGAFDGTAHTEAWNDLNGYTVKVWYDPYYLQPASGGGLDYTVPTGAYESGDYSGSFDDVGYYVYRSGNGAATIGGRSYRYASVTVFYSGFWLPQKADGALWYNLARLPLKAVHTGGTDVWIETDEAIDPVNVTDALELFAKNESGDYDPTFRWTAVNGGYHHINIVEKVKPAPPTPNPVAGSYTTGQNVSLTADPDCTIWYSIDGATYTKYTAPIHIAYTQTVRTFAERESDGKRSNTVAYAYNIIPEAPRLFEDIGGTMTAIENAHYETNPFTVHAAVGDAFAVIPDGSSVYYTFSETLSADDLAPHVGDDPETSWVEVSRATPKVGDNPADTITGRHTVRLVTVMGAEHSDVNWYYLGVQPAPVSFEPPFGIKTDPSVTVTMDSATVGAAICYTTDGSDPRSSPTAQPYDNGARPVFADDVSIRAAALYDGVWSEVTGTWYVFDLKDDFGVAAFYPPGVYEGAVSVTLTAQNPDYDIRYSFDGVTWLDYIDTLEIGEDTDVYAKTRDPNTGNEGTVYGPFRYTIRPEPPIFAPTSTQFTNADEITVFCGGDRTDANGERFLLYYTTDGSDPTVSPTRAQADASSDAVIVPITKYTVVRAAVQRDGATWSSVVTHAYDIVTGKATAPLTTLAPGFHTLDAGQEPYTTQFVPVPTGTTIYYTTDGSAPDVNNPSQAYVPGTDIPVNGHEIINAVAVNALGYKSDVAIFDYTVAPAAPKAAPSAVVGGDTLPTVPVVAVENATVTYTVNDVPWSFDNTGDTVFYLDTDTGIAYRDAERTQPLVDTGTAQDFGGQATVTLKAELDGVESGTNTYVYRTRNDGVTLAPPWADRATGTYEERALDAQNTLLNVRLDSLNSDGTVQYRLNNGAWQNYDGAIRLSYRLDGGVLADDSPIGASGTAVLQARVVGDGIASGIVSYVYSFVPTPPEIDLASGRYSYAVDTDGNRVYPSTTLSLADDAPTTAGLYDIYYRSNGDARDYRYTGAKRTIDHTMSFRAYTVNKLTGQLSENTVHYYIIESPTVATGTVYTVSPYEVLNGDRRDIASHLLDDELYNEGIKLRTQARDVVIRYYYTWTGVADGQDYTTSTLTYDPAMPIFVNSSMSDLVIQAWLEDENGAKVDGSNAVFTYHFIPLGIPVTSLGDSREVPKNTTYAILDDYPDDAKITIRYTLDGSDPTVYGAPYGGETLSVDNSTTVRAVYRHVCDRCASCKDGRPEDCLNAVYGEIGTYRYTVPTEIHTGGGGGGIGGGGGGSAPATLYDVDTGENEGGTVTSNVDKASRGDTVVVTAEPRAGYRVAKVTVTTKSGRQIDAMLGMDGRYRFIMPDESVVIDCAFVPATTPLDKTGVSRLLNSDDHVQYIIGYDDGDLHPLNNITRAETAMMLYRLLLQPRVEKTVGFYDVGQGSWCAEPVLTLASLGIINGSPDGAFLPAKDITRAEFTAMAVRFANPAEGDYRYNDVSETHWASKAIATASAYGWIQGYGDGSFRPEQPIKRAEAATVLNAMLLRAADRDYVTAHADELNQFSDLQNSSVWYYYTMIEASNSHDYHRENGVEVWDGTD